jgi:hypothetical protein
MARHPVRMHAYGVIWRRRSVLDPRPRTKRRSITDFGEVTQLGGLGLIFLRHPPVIHALRAHIFASSTRSA